MPFVNGDDSKMTPNTFQGVTLFGKTPWLKYGAGYLFKMKQKTADQAPPSPRSGPNRGPASPSGRTTTS
jgi:hypothetical protein